jgi:Ca2+-dependent lipid-binding protein
LGHNVPQNHTTMAKKKTSVVLPGGIQGLVHNLQSGNVAKPDTAKKEEQQAASNEQEASQETEGVAEARTEAPQQVAKSADNVSTGAQQSSTAATAQSVETEKSAQAKTMNTEDQGEGTGSNKEYHVIKDDTNDSWDLFLDLAERYKNGNGKLATIYIDPQLKSVLDRLKYAGSVKLSTSAILSSIVARFIYDHEDKIKETIFGGKLL